MKFVQYLVLFLFVNVFCISHGFCEDVAVCSKKTYVQPNQIHIESDGIFVQLSDQWFITEAIHLDAGGVYVNDASCKASFSWKCPKCGHENKWYHKRCQKCGY